MPALSTKELIAAIVEWYGLEDMGTGGPLHIVTDDYNVEDWCLDSCRKYLLDHSMYDHIRTIDWTVHGLQILDGLRALEYGDRKVIIREAHRQLASPTLAVPMVPELTHSTRTVRERFYASQETTS